VLEAAQQIGVDIVATCGGKGVVKVVASKSWRESFLPLPLRNTRNWENTASSVSFVWLVRPLPEATVWCVLRRQLLNAFIKYWHHRKIALSPCS
jgi:hypothetical protein